MLDVWRQEHPKSVGTVQLYYSGVPMRKLKKNVKGHTMACVQALGFVHCIRTHLSTDPASQTSRSVVLSQWSLFVLVFYWSIHYVELQRKHV